MEPTRLILLLLLFSACRLSAQNAYEVRFTAGSVQHVGLLVGGKNASEWQIRIRYFDSQQKCQRLIEQKMRAEKTNLGTRLHGYSVWDVQKKQQAADYAADNFYLTYDQHGNVYSKNIDAQGTTVSVQMTALREDQKKVKMQEFGWP
ncbi:MAG: hypothetical protein IPJ82_14355 [Lewinellaceae bacterium]|nr:hypothetical protein [Lewinellaceae bacterium]